MTSPTLSVVNLIGSCNKSVFVIFFPDWCPRLPAISMQAAMKVYLYFIMFLEKEASYMWNQKINYRKTTGGKIKMINGLF